MVKRFGLVGALMGFVVVVCVGIPAKAESPEEGSRQFIQGMAEQAVQSLTAQDIPRSERVKRFRVLFNEKFAVKSIGKFVLGRHWRNTSAEQKVEYLALFEDLMVISYVDRFGRYAGESLDLKKTRPENNTTITVFSEIKRPGAAKPISVHWRVGTDGTIYKVLDVVVEGTSMSSTLRSDFGSIVRQNKGEVSGLIEELKKKTASLKDE